MRIDPIKDSVIIKQDEGDTISKGGILLPGGEEKKPLQGTVLAVGPGKYSNGVFIKTEIKPGQRILYRKFSGNEFELNGEKLVALPEDAIIGVITNE